MILYYKVLNKIFVLLLTSWQNFVVSTERFKIKSAYLYNSQDTISFNFISMHLYSQELEFQSGFCPRLTSFFKKLFPFDVPNKKGDLFLFSYRYQMPNHVYYFENLQLHPDERSTQSIQHLWISFSVLFWLFPRRNCLEIHQRSFIRDQHSKSTFTVKLMTATYSSCTRSTNGKISLTDDINVVSSFYSDKSTNASSSLSGCKVREHCFPGNTYILTDTHAGLYSAQEFIYTFTYT